MLASMGNLDQLDDMLVASLWPAERVLVGMKVSKRLRKALLLGASRVVFHGTAEKQEGSSAQKVCADLMRFQSKDVHLEIQIRSSYHLKGIILDSIGEKDVYSHLSFNDTKLDMEDIQQLSRKLGYTANLSHLEIRANSLVDNVGVDILSTGLKTLRNLNKLILVSCNIRDLGAASIATTIDQGLFQLDTLDMGCNSIESHGASRVLSSLRRCKSLRHLNLRSNLIGDRGAIFFASLLCETFQQPSAGDVDSKVELPWAKLSSVNLSRNQISANACNALAEGLPLLPSLSSLDLGCNHIEDEGASKLSPGIAACSSLTTTNLNDGAIGDEGITCLAEALCKRKNSKIAHIHLAKNMITDEGGASLAKAVWNLPCLRSITVSNCSIAGAGGLELISALGQCEHLQSINFRNNGSFCDSHKEEHPDTSLLRNSKTLQSIDFSRNPQLNFATLLGGMSSCAALSSVNLAHNFIEDDEVAHLAALFQQCRKLQTLNLSWNAIGDTGATKLSEMLAACSALTAVDLSWNQISESTILELSDARPRNCRLLTGHNALR